MIHFKLTAFEIGNNLSVDIDLSGKPNELVMLLAKASERNDSVKEIIGAAFFSYCTINHLDPMLLMKQMYILYQKEQMRLARK